MSKLIRDGKVAVLYSPSFGAGWSTWNNGKDGLAEFMSMDEKVVHAFLEGGGGAAASVVEAAYPGEYVCVLGARDLKVAWIDEGTKFRIDEYDGSESIETLGNIDFLTA